MGTLVSNLGEAVDAGVTALQAVDLRSDIDSAHDAMDGLYRARVRLYAGLEAGFPNPVLINGTRVSLRDLVRQVDLQQDKVDRAQNRAFGKAIAALWAHVFGDVARILGRRDRDNACGGFLSGGESAWGAGLLGVGIGALFGSLFSGRGRAGRSVEPDDEAPNVPPADGGDDRCPPSRPCRR